MMRLSAATEPTRRRAKGTKGTRRAKKGTRRRRPYLVPASEKPLLRPECPWYCYMLTSPASRVPYIGKTNDLARRLREHNGELAGGAKRTHRTEAVTGTWTRVLHVAGFPDERAALNFEWRWTYDCRRLAGRALPALERGVRALAMVLPRDCPTSVALPFAAYASGGVTIIPETEPAATALAAVAVPPNHRLSARPRPTESVDAADRVEGEAGADT